LKAVGARDELTALSAAKPSPRQCSLLNDVPESTGSPMEDFTGHLNMLCSGALDGVCALSAFGVFPARTGLRADGNGSLSS
jgi:hypothetical protein